MSLPNWLIQQLIRSGKTDDNLLTTKTKPRLCECGIYTLKAYDEPICGLLQNLDAYPTTDAGERWAHTQLRSTWRIDLQRRISPREWADLQHHSANQLGTVHATHRCGAPPLPMHPKFQQRREVGLGPPPF